MTKIFTRGMLSVQSSVKEYEHIVISIGDDLTDPETEIVCIINISLVPDLIAVLRLSQV